MIEISHPALEVMIPSVRAACRITVAVQRDLVSAGTVTKGDRSPVTVADFAAQAIVAHHLAEHLPDLPLVGEESADLLRRAENAAVLEAVVAQVRREWADADAAGVLEAIDRGGGEAAERFLTLDPIDGTKGFLRGEQYAVAFGLIEDGIVTAGVLGCPNLPGPAGSKGAVFAAVRGKGAAVLPLVEGEAEPAPIRVSAETDPTRARFCESVEKAHSHKGRAARTAEILGVTAEPVRIDSQCKYGLVARGDAELYLRIPRDDVYREKIWDHAAGMIIVEEAGGRVTDVAGNPLDFSRGSRLEENRGVIASNGPIHEAVLAALSQTA